MLLDRPGRTLLALITALALLAMPGLAQAQTDLALNKPRRPRRRTPRPPTPPTSTTAARRPAGVPHSDPDDSGRPVESMDTDLDDTNWRRHVEGARSG
jgi:hypothetical protein